MVQLIKNLILYNILLDSNASSAAINIDNEEKNNEPGHATVIEVREDESLLPPDGESELVLHFCNLDVEI